MHILANFSNEGRAGRAHIGSRAAAAGTELAGAAYCDTVIALNMTIGNNVKHMTCTTHVFSIAAPVALWWMCSRKETSCKHTRDTDYFIHAFSSLWDGGFHILKELQLQPPHLVIMYTCSPRSRSRPLSRALSSSARRPLSRCRPRRSYWACSRTRSVIAPMIEYFELSCKDMHFVWHFWCHSLSLNTVYV